MVEVEMNAMLMGGEGREGEGGEVEVEMDG